MNPMFRPSWPVSVDAGNLYCMQSLEVEQVKLLLKWYSGILIMPEADLSNVWQDSAGTTPGAIDAPVGKLLCVANSSYWAEQATSNWRPFLRSANQVIGQFTDATSGGIWTTSSTATLTSDSALLQRDGTGTYFRSPGTAASDVSIPDAAANSITGDMTLILKLSLNTWVDGVAQYIAGKYGASGQYSWNIQKTTDNKLQLLTSADGTTTITTAHASTATVDFSAGAVKWLKIVLDVDNGAGGHDVKYYTSDDGVTWSQFGSTVTTAGTTSLFNSTQSVAIGTYKSATAGNSPGKFYYAAAWSNTTGEGIPAWEFNPARDASFPTAPWLHMDGTQTYLQMAGGFGTPAIGHLLVAGMQSSTTAAYRGWAGSGVGSGGYTGVSIGVNTADLAHMSLYNGSTYQTLQESIASMPQYKKAVLDILFKTAYKDINVNGAQRNTAASYTSPATGREIAIGCRFGATAINFTRGMISVLVCIPQEITAVELDLIRQYAAQRIGVIL